MYVTADRRDSILDNIKTEPMATLYKGLQEEAIGDLTPIDTTDWDAKDHGKNGELAAINAFLAWINNDENAAQRALDAMATLESNWDDHTQWGINIRMPLPMLHYTAAWDFLSATSFMSKTQAAAIEEKLTAITEQFYDKYVLDDFMRYTGLTVTQNNHPIRTACAVGFVALAFQDHPNSKTWLDWAVSELDYLLGPNGQYIQPDGAISEGPFYFNFGFAPTIPFFIALENRESSERIYHRNCINRAEEEPWAEHSCVQNEPFTFTNPMYSDLFHDIMDWSLSLRLPNGNRAPIADSPLRNPNGQSVFTYFGAPDYLYWDWESNPSAPFNVTGGFDLVMTHLAYVKPHQNTQPPEWKTRFFIEGGMANFRSGWDSDARLLILMGENGAARKTVHDHTDGTSFVMAAYGDMLLMDTGYYKPNSLQNAVTSAAGSHNLILIDGQGAPTKGLLTDWGDADAFIENTVDGDDLAFAESRQNYQNTEVIRGVTFARERYFIVADRLNAEDDEERTYQFRLHAYAGKDVPGTVTLEQHGPHIVKTNGAVQVFTQSSSGHLTLEEPSFEENASPHVHKLDKDPEHHTVTDATVTGNAPDFLTVLAPYKTGSLTGIDSPLTVTGISTQKGAAWHVKSETFSDVVWVREADAPIILQLSSGETITTDGAYIFVSLDGNLGILSRGTELKLNDTVLISASVGEKVTIKQ